MSSQTGGAEPLLYPLSYGGSAAKGSAVPARLGAAPMLRDSIDIARAVSDPDFDWHAPTGGVGLAAAQQEPRLTVVSDGPLRGATYLLRRGNQLVGRSDEADVVVTSPDLSRRHAYVSWDGSDASIVDAGSTNGTIVNDQLISGTRPLRPGDVIRLGSLELRFDVPVTDVTSELAAVGAPGPQWQNEFRGDNYGDIHQAGRDVNVHARHEHRYGPDDPIDELFQGRGPGRLLMAVGLVVALCGFAGWMYLILSAATSVGDGGPSSGGGPFETEWLGLPAGMVAFGAFALGGVIAGIGGSMSKAARARERELRHAQPRW